MNTFVKLRPLARQSYFGLKLAEGSTAKVHQSNYAFDITTPGGIVEANQSFTITVGHIAPKNYTVVAFVNPTLQNNAVGPTSFAVEPGEELELSLKFKALRKLDLTDLAYTVRLYLID